MELSTTELLIIGLLFIALAALLGLAYVVRQNTRLAEQLRDLVPPGLASDLVTSVTVRVLDEVKTHTDATPNKADDALYTMVRGTVTDVLKLAGITIPPPEPPAAG